MKLPPWFEQYRTWQTPAVAKIVNAFTRTNVVFLDAPTGSGKTLIAESVRQIMQSDAVYICVTKQLQDQFLNDYQYSRILKGRSNYPTELHPSEFYASQWSNRITADDCTGDECQLCTGKDNCPYQIARFNAASSPLAVLNLAYAINEFQSQQSRFSHRKLKIIDECDVAESVILSNASISISPKQQQRLNINKPAKKTVEDAWFDWARITLTIVESNLARLPRSKGSDMQDIVVRRQRRYLTNLKAKLLNLRDDLADTIETGEKSWVYTGYDSDYIEFKPVKVDSYAEEMLFSRGGKWLLMSGTIISPAALADDLGIEHYEVVQVDYAFDAKRRPVFIRPAGPMNRREQESSVLKVAMEIANICKEHSGGRILIHTHTYKLSETLFKLLTPSLGGRLLMYRNSMDKGVILARYLETPNSVLLAPSLDRGVDLPYDACDVQIISNVPFPYLGDKQIAARTYGTRGGQLWYSVQTARTIVQMTGRGMRHADDSCETYILDSDFVKFLRDKKHLFPQWWKEAIVWQKDRV